MKLHCTLRELQHRPSRSKHKRKALVRNLMVVTCSWTMKMMTRLLYSPMRRMRKLTKLLMMVIIPKPPRP